ncbi:MAG: hypothetical protein WCA44_05965 [Acidobacteriaceae bacterium]
MSTREIIEKIDQLREELRSAMSTVNQGLANLQQADSDLAAAITANTTAVNEAVADIQSLSSKLSAAAGDPDSTVGQIAADLETKVAALSSATSALTAAVTPPAAVAPGTPASTAPAGS